MNSRLLQVGIAFLTLSAMTQADAFAVDMSGIRGKLPSDDKMKVLEQQMQANPWQLDAYFAYAQMATALGDFEKAAGAYEHMLTTDPELDRVKLELGVVYMKLQKYDDAEDLLNQVLAKDDLPPRVRENVKTVLARLEEASKEHFFTGSVSLGVLYDSNGNAAADSDRVSIRFNGQDQIAVLTPASQTQHDMQMFTSASLNHRYKKRDKLAEDLLFGWSSGISAYRSEQEHLDSLNLQVFSARTGPTFNLTDIGLILGLTADYTHIILDGHSYMRLPSVEFSGQYMLADDLKLSAALKQEFRDFLNSPTVSTYQDRTGHAQQARLGFTWAATRQDIINLGVTARTEDTKRVYYDNQQQRVDLGYTRLWEYDVFTRAQSGFRNTIYDGPDPIISLRTRHDTEYNVGFTVGRQFDKNITLTGGYQYRKVDSNIQNYEYDNHRYTTSVNVRF